MPECTTTNCSRLGHPEVLVSYDDQGVVVQDVHDLMRILEDMVATGSSFVPGQTIEFGWLYGQFREHNPGLLTLFEPDLRTFPVAWTPGVTNILVTRRLQLDVADSFGLREDATFTTFRHTCLICSMYKAGVDFFMTRFSPENAISGWFIGCLDDGHDHNDPANLKCISTYELVTTVSRSPLMYLALPPEVVVQVVNELPRAGLPDRHLPVIPGSFVDALFRRNASAV